MPTYTTGATPGVGAPESKTLPWRAQLEKKIIEQLQEIRIGRQFLDLDRSLVGQSGASKKLRVEDSAYYTIVSFRENADIAAMTSIGHAETEFTPGYYGGYDEITGLSLKSADVNMTRRMARYAANGIARGEDRRIWAAIMNKTLTNPPADTTGMTEAEIEAAATAEAVGTGDGAVQWFQLDNAKVLSMVEVKVAGVAKTPITDYYVDYYRGWIYFNTAPALAEAITAKYYYTDRTAVEAATIGTMSYSDMVSAQVQLGASYVNTTDIILREDAAGDMKVDDKFINALRVGLEKPKVGKVVGAQGNILGCNVFTTQQLPEKIGVMLGRDLLGVYLVKEDVTTEFESIERRAGDKRFKFWVNTIPCILRPGSVAIILNAQTSAKQYSA